MYTLSPCAFPKNPEEGLCVVNGALFAAKLAELGRTEPLRTR